MVCINAIILIFTLLSIKINELYFFEITELLIVCIIQLLNYNLSINIYIYMQKMGEYKFHFTYISKIHFIKINNVNKFPVI